MRCGPTDSTAFLRPRSIAMAVAIIITAKPISRTVPGMNRASTPPR
jgi:hypothetical protein